MPFAPTSLDDLERRTALEVRTDLKYVVDLEVFDRVAAELRGDHLALVADERRTFAYDTVYFDTPALLTYHQHLQGRRKRFKCRTRLYVAAGRCFVEVKLRDGRERTLKRKLEVDRVAHGSLDDESLRFVDDALRSAYGYPAPQGLEPTLRTAFTRLTLVARDASERVTCDVGLTLAAGGGGHAWELQQGKVLVETKTLAGNGAADRALRRLGARPVGGFSKYCVGLALVRPELRRNRFARVLRKHFSADPVRPPLAA